MLDSYWIKRDTNIEAVADYKFCKAMKFSHKAVNASGQVKNLEMSKAIKLFEESYEIASKNLSPANPLTILIALNFSNFQFLRLGFVDKALAIATEAYNKGFSHLHAIPEELKILAEKLLDELKHRIYYLKQQKRFKVFV